VLYCSICGLKTRVVDQVHERDLLQSWRKFKISGLFWVVKTKTVAMRDGEARW
jgi:hypothetical protein